MTDRTLGKAKESQLGDLHGKLAEVYDQVLDLALADPTIVDPKLLNQVQAFLKSNDISCEMDTDMQDKADTLHDQINKNKQKLRSTRSGNGEVVPMTEDASWWTSDDE